MTDPAISAAQKVLAAWSEDGEPEGAERYLAEAAAREALKPIRDWSASWSIELLRRDLGQAWSELAPLIFTSEEMA
ncbi:hypothetical protein [Mycobacteroides abscessus]|uniref:hypothetical protein n=1 Tax=Mycobacteroides abscessus TaxID=36809 RepID=UPI0009A878BA|nr:hypothetical protein [Mycobacteroides abscessus]SKW03827.1 Uncharacterised protein [Mycobacteroides abscessus subsp. abscessus]